MDNAALTTQKILNFGEGGEGGTGTSPCEACSCIPANPADSTLTSQPYPRDGRICKANHRKPPWCRAGMPGGVRGRGCEAPAYSICARSGRCIGLRAGSFHGEKLSASSPHGSGSLTVLLGGTSGAAW